MMDDYSKKEEFDGEKRRDEIFSKAVKAGKRTYFFDVKSTRRDDYYLTITESKKKSSPDGRFFYEKHKIFLYKEDFEKFTTGLKEVIDFIIEQRGEFTGFDYGNHDNNQDNINQDID